MYPCCYLSNLQFELFLVVADVSHCNVDDRQPRGLHVLHADDRLGPLRGLVLKMQSKVK